MYKPPEGEDYVKLNEALDALYDKLNKLEGSKSSNGSRKRKTSSNV
jgi:hypothetical protein